MKILLDEDLSPKIAAILRDKGLDALSVHDIGRTGFTDYDQLEFAASKDRCFITRNRNDYILLTRQFFSTGKSHKGLLVVPSTYKPHDFKGIAKAIYKRVIAWRELPTDYLFDFV
jgi:uncharacterized protein with PIN domain